MEGIAVGGGFECGFAHVWVVLLSSVLECSKKRAPKTVQPQRRLALMMRSRASWQQCFGVYSLLLCWLVFNTRQNVLIELRCERGSLVEHKVVYFGDAARMVRLKKEVDYKGSVHTARNAIICVCVLGGRWFVLGGSRESGWCVCALFRRASEFIVIVACGRSQRVGTAQFKPHCAQPVREKLQVDSHCETSDIFRTCTRHHSWPNRIRA